MYINKDTKEVLTWKEMQRQWREAYDGDDPTNLLTWRSQYSRILSEDLDKMESLVALCRSHLMMLKDDLATLGDKLFPNGVEVDTEHLETMMEDMEDKLKTMYLLQQESEAKEYRLI